MSLVGLIVSNTRRSSQQIKSTECQQDIVNLGHMWMLQTPQCTMERRVYYQGNITLHWFSCLFALPCVSLNRPPGGLRFYRDSSSSIFFFRQLTSELAERNSNETGHINSNQIYLRHKAKYQ